MSGSIDDLRPNARLRLAAHSAAAAADLAAMAEGRDRPFGDGRQAPTGRQQLNGRALGGRTSRSGGPRAIGDSLVQLFSQQRSFEEALASPAEPALEVALRRPAPTGIALVAAAPSLVVL